ncbi:MAG: DUF2089 family protein [Gammaproteobacteria bacterium]|jgi:hypothetical protein
MHSPRSQAQTWERAIVAPSEHPINVSCPSCGQPMAPCVLECTACELRLEGSFRQNEFAGLEAEYLHLLRIFVTCEGRIREMEAALGVSYPTVKARIADLKARLGLGDEVPLPNRAPAAVAAPAASSASSASSAASAQQTKTAQRTTDNMDILDALDRGEVDFEEALRRVKGETPKER